jgi:hypothetical protein
VKVERSPKFDRDGIAMRLAAATIRREAVVFSFLFEFRVRVDSCEKLLEGTAAFFVLSPHPRRWFGFDAVQFNRRRNTVSDGFTAARDRRCRLTHASRSANQGIPQARLKFRAAAIWFRLR